MARKTPQQADTGFASLGLDPRILQSLTALGYEEPTPIQREVIPPLLEGKDIIGQAATGTGKTAAFALPIIQRLSEMDGKRPRPAAVVLVPTRELATQVAEAMHKYGRPLGISVLPIYGGQAYGPQLRALKQGVDVVVATPGRALDHIRRGTMPLSGIRIVVLDEADEMLDMGFADDIESVLAETPSERQTVLVSATLPPRIAGIAERHLRDAVKIKIAGEPSAEGGDLPRIRQVAYVIHRSHKPAALGRILDVENPTSTIVFCRTRTEVDELTETLISRGYRAEPLHGGMSQDQRSRVIKKLRAEAIDLIVATDVAARGLDIPQLSHVINYDVPNAAESYVHRIGRVGRAGREGVAITLTAPREHRLLRDFERATKQKIEVGRVPTVADLRARRLELTRASLREMLLAGDLDSYRPVVESLCDEFDLIEISLAAIKLAHQATGGDTEEAEEIPNPSPVSDAIVRRGPGQDGGSKRKFSGKSGGGRSRGPSPGTARLFVAAGRSAGVRPQDLVGAIAAEAGLKGRDVGAIEIADRFSLVEVPEETAETVIKALRAGTIRGKKVTVRRDQKEG